MSDLKWSESEKKLARRVFESALQAEVAEIMAEFKAKAAAVSTPDEMWALRDYLPRKERGLLNKYEYRYSQLVVLFSWLLREGRIQKQDLQGLSKEKLEHIERILAP